MDKFDYAETVSEAFASYNPKFRGLDDEALRLSMAAERLARERLPEEEFASLTGYGFLAVAESPTYRDRFVTIDEDAGRHDLLEAAAKPAEWGAELPWAEHLAIIERLGAAGHGGRVLRIWRHFISKIGQSFWWWVQERNRSVARREKGLAPELGSVAEKEYVEAVIEHKTTFLAALELTEPAFDHFGNEHDRNWLKQRREEVEAEKRARAVGKPDPTQMSEDLWQIVSSGGETFDERLDTLPERLASYSANTIKAFGQLFLDKTAAAYREDIWALAYLLMRGASDDAFDAFRNWLVLQGRETYDATLLDPDQFDVSGTFETPMAEGVHALIEEAYELRSGKPMLWPKHPKTEIGPINENEFPAMLPSVAKKLAIPSH